MKAISKTAVLCLLSLPMLGRCNDATEGGGDPNAGGSGSILTNWVGRPGQDPIEPSKDPFYSNVPSNLTDYSNGQIINLRPISVSGSYQGVEAACQVRLKSEDAHDGATISLASILVPAASSSNSIDNKNVIVYQIPEDATYVDCAPTYQLFSRATVPEIQALLSQGFVVVIPDYEGIRGSFTVGKLAGKQILDAAKAALSIPYVKHSNQTASVGVWGYGTGAHASGWAAELASTYAPELPLKAAALGGVISNLRNWISVINNTPDADQVVTSLLGMASEYRDVSDALTNNVSPRHRNQFENGATRCSFQNKLHYFNTDVNAQFFNPGVDIFGQRKVQNVYDLNNLGKAAPKASVFIYRGSDDTVSSLKDTQVLLKSYCSGGSPVKYREISGASHGSARSQYDEVLDYFTSTLAGNPSLNSCQRIKNGDFMVV